MFYVLIPSPKKLAHLTPRLPRKSLCHNVSRYPPPPPRKTRASDPARPCPEPSDPQPSKSHSSSCWACPAPLGRLMTMTSPADNPRPAVATPWPFRPSVVVAVLCLLAALLRFPQMLQSLWYDEIVTITNSISQPWATIVAGQYSPNNHVLYSLLAKAVDLLASGSDLALAARIPSFLAGIAAAVAFAWPLLRTRPGYALLLGLLLAMHPWAISFSGWARGYALLLTLAIVATELLAQRRIGLAYAATLVAAIYTLPLAIGIIVGHGATMLLPDYRKDLRRWLTITTIAIACAGLLYLPFLASANQYWSSPGQPGTTYAAFILGSLRHAIAGDDLPSDNLPSAVYLILSLFVCAAGAWRWTQLRPAILTFAVAQAFALLVPLLIPSAGEVRAALWGIPLFCLGAFGLLTLPSRRSLGKWAAIGAWVAMFLFLGLRDYDIATVPAQPIAEASQLARSTATPAGHVIGLYMASHEARAAYGGIDTVAMTLDALQQAEARAPQPLVAVTFYESFIQRDQPELWRHLQEHYTLVQRLPGRISPAAVYLRRPDHPEDRRRTLLPFPAHGFHPLDDSVQPVLQFAGCGSVT